MLSNFRCVPLPFWKFWSLTAQLRSRRAVSGHLISRPQEVGALHFADTWSIFKHNSTGTWEKYKKSCCAANCFRFSTSDDDFDLDDFNFCLNQSSIYHPFHLSLRISRKRSDLLFFFAAGTSWADQCCRSWPGARARRSDDGRNPADHQVIR